MDDVRAVLDAVGSRRAVLLGVSEGGPMCSLFAATHPDQTEALIMIGTYARRLRAPDYPWAPTREQREAFFREIVEHWGGPVGHRGAGAERRRTIRRSGSGGRRSCAWAPARRRRSRSRR